MENEKDSVTLLLEYAQKNGYEPESGSSFKRLLISPADPVLSNKTVLFEVEKGFWFIAKDSFAAKSGSGSTFSGIYTVIDINTSTLKLDSSFRCQIHVKETLDFLFRWNSHKTGNRRIDSELTITCNQKQLPENIFRENCIFQFKELYAKVKPVSIIIENDYLPWFSALKGKMVIGIEANYWVYLDEQLDKLIRTGIPLIKSIINNQSI